MRIWKSADGSRWINLDHLSLAHRKSDGSLCVFLVADSEEEFTATLKGTDAESFLAAKLVEVPVSTGQAVQQ